MAALYGSELNTCIHYIERFLSVVWSKLTM